MGFLSKLPRVVPPRWHMIVALSVSNNEVKRREVVLPLYAPGLWFYIRLYHTRHASPEGVIVRLSPVKPGLPEFASCNP